MITWEGIIILGVILGLSGVLVSCVVSNYNKTASVIGTIICTSISTLSFLFIIPLAMAQSTVKDKYEKYVELCEQYESAEGFDKEYLEMTDIITYNMWYSSNKSKLEDKWHLWGTSEYSDKFDYIEIRE